MGIESSEYFFIDPKSTWLIKPGTGSNSEKHASIHFPCQAHLSLGENEAGVCRAIMDV
jgi:hypothetical protein